MAENKPDPKPVADFDSLAALGHGIPAALGLASAAAAVGAVQIKLQPTLVISLIAIGVALPLLAWRSWKGNRAAWAFLVSLSIVLGIMTLFGAPKVRNLVGVSLGVALVIPLSMAVAAFCLSSLSDRYKS